VEADAIGNELVRWALAPGVAAVAFVVLLGAKLIAHRLAPTPRDPRLGHAIVAHIEHGTKWPVLLLQALYLGSLTLDLTDTAHDVLRAVAVVALLLQSGLWGAELITVVAERYQQRAVEEERTLTPATVYALRFIGSLALWSVLFLVALENVGVEVTALVAGLGIGGIAVALAAQSVLGDLFASLGIVLDRPFEVGDFIITGEMMGTVEKVGIKTTRVRSLSGEELIFPNSDLAGSRIRNYKRMLERRVLFDLGVVYDTPVELVERATQIVREAIEGQELTRFDRAHFSAFGPSALNIQAVYYVLSPDYNVFMDVHQAINLQILRRFRAEGLEFAFPTQTIHVYDEVVDRNAEVRAPA
jgi:small-conductance mechanosensitive channel